MCRRGLGQYVTLWLRACGWDQCLDFCSILQNCRLGYKKKVWLSKIVCYKYLTIFLLEQVEEENNGNC